MAATTKERKLEKRAESAEKRMTRMREENKGALAKATRTAFTMGGALAMAYWYGRYPDKTEILGLDASLVVGAGLTIAALMGWAGAQEDAAEALGNGALASFAATKGFEFGGDALAKA
ncbi:hypothetical protein LCGC14_0982190 [marine sediment metagenome]|uniref:Uncharacterized protein n=1 Tax=marine sediment metagenome TaxID=412755 RepID=A0A0F9NUS2_9ZZZZ